MSYLCFCGHVIKDNEYPCPETGDLKWQPESENASQDANQSLREFFNAIESGAKDEWLSQFFGSGSHFSSMTINSEGTHINESKGESIYLTADLATIVCDIMSRYENREGHSVYRCPECDRLYIQKEYRSDEYECFEKRTGYSR